MSQYREIPKIIVEWMNDTVEHLPKHTRTDWNKDGTTKSGLLCMGEEYDEKQLILKISNLHLTTGFKRHEYKTDQHLYCPHIVPPYTVRNLNDIYVFGSWDNWEEPVQIDTTYNKHGAFKVVVPSEGFYQYKAKDITTDHWYMFNHLPIKENNGWDKNHVVEVIKWKYT